MEMSINTGSRKLVHTDVNEMDAHHIITTHKYDDGTILKFHLKGGKVSVKCNKTLVVEPDGVTVNILD